MTTTTQQPSSGGTILTAAGEAPPVDSALNERFRPIFERIAVGANEREADHVLPFEQVGWLKEAGFGALRVSQRVGGGGASQEQLFRLLIELAAADSNVAHLLRGHFAFVEQVLTDPNERIRSFWLDKILAGELVGNASSELGGSSGWWDTKTVAAPDDSGVWLLNGAKYYSTGTIFADWISVSAVGPDGAKLHIPVRVDAPGVHVEDDWDGFGQQLTGSGTTTFTDVEVDPELITPVLGSGPTFLLAYFQLFLLAVQAGIGRAIVGDAAAFVRPRTRKFLGADSVDPRHDPQVQAVVGRLAAASRVVDSAVLGAARTFDSISNKVADGSATDADFEQLDIEVYQVQIVASELVLRAATELFEVGGASTTSTSRRLDRHWRNARTIATHNPIVIKEKLVGDYVLNGASPQAAFGKLKDPAAADGAKPVIA